MSTPQETGIVNSQPTNLNALYNTAFKLVVESKNNLNFFVVATNTPGLQLGSVQQMTPFGSVPWSGDPQFEELQVQFIVDEDLNNWIEVQNWLRAASVVGDYDDYNRDEIFRDGTLVLKTAQYNPNIAIRFKGLVPIALSGFDLDTREDRPSVITSTITFAYVNYEIERIT
jgi:hypothetical protein